MLFNNEQVVFKIPSLSTEWIFPAQLYFNRNDERFYVCSELDESKGRYICKFSIFHTIIGDIKRFDITCRDFNTKDLIFEFILHPILNQYCTENLIELKFDDLNYE
jgi:hypothetical protein